MRNPLVNEASKVGTGGWLKELRGRVLVFLLAGLYFGALILAESPNRFNRRPQEVILALATLTLGGIVWLVSRWKLLPAMWLFVIGALLLDWTMIVWGGFDLAVLFLIFPVNIAVLTLGPLPGIIVTTFCTLSLLSASPYSPQLPAPLRNTTIVLMWGTMGLTWLAIHSLIRVVQWAWDNYYQSRTALERARDYQARLHEALDDLATVNAQLVRVNNLVQALRQAAEEERHAKEQFVANVSHELRTPLNMIIGFCEMITESPETYGENIPPALLADLAVVLRNSQHLSNLIDDVLDLSQIEAGQMALIKERVSIAEVIQSAVTAIRPLFDSKDLYLRTDIPADLPTVFCDRTRIYEVVLNLLSNAGRFTERGGATVCVRRQGDDVVVSVTDTGPGIAKEDQRRIFRPFQQVEGSLRRRYGGTGLGLSISKMFIELHGGTMWLQSERERGTTIFFRLPIDPPLATADDALRWFSPYHQYERRPRRRIARRVAFNPRMLVVERGTALRRLLSRYMDGVEVVPAGDLDTALERLQKGEVVQAVLINTPDVGGVLDRLGERRPPYNAPTIICSVPGVEEAADELGVTDYLVKPVSRESLLAALDRLKVEVKNILLVDDEPDALRLFRRMLASSDRGYRVLRASDGRQALETLRRLHPDVVLLDLIMPEMNGFQFLAIKNRDPELRQVPVILISARDPLGQPIISDALAVTCADGLSAQHLLACVESFISIISGARNSRR